MRVLTVIVVERHLGVLAFDRPDDRTGGARVAVVGLERPHPGQFDRTAMDSPGWAMRRAGTLFSVT